MKAPVAAVLPMKNWAKSAVVRTDGYVLLQADAAGGEAGQQRAVFGADSGWSWLRSGSAGLQRRSAAVATELVAVRLLTVKSAVGSLEEVQAVPMTVAQ